MRWFCVIRWVSETQSVQICVFGLKPMRQIVKKYRAVGSKNAEKRANSLDIPENM